LHRELIIALASRHRLPAVYSNRLFVASGGLLSYSPDRIDQFRRAAAYVDRILKGEKPADLPVQAPTRYETVLTYPWTRMRRSPALSRPLAAYSAAPSWADCIINMCGPNLRQGQGESG
jgi:hypothetical protein